MSHHTVALTEKIGGDWSIAGIGCQVKRLKVFHIGEAPPGSVVNIDCSSIEDIDYSGFQLLYVWCRFIKEKGLRSELVNIPERMRMEQARLGLDRSLLQGQ